MDSISTAELLELIFSANSVLDLQFQFWLAITFALIVATFTAKERLSKKVRLVISFLYLASTIVIFYRWWVSAQIAIEITEEVIARGVTWVAIANPFSGILRLLVFLVGTISTLWFLNTKDFFYDANDNF